MLTLASAISDVKAELKKLNHSLLLSVLETLDAATKRSSQHAEKVEDIMLLVRNMIQLISESRPAQAYDRLIEIMETQNKEQLTVVDSIRTDLSKVKQILSESTKTLTSFSDKHETARKKADEAKSADNEKSTAERAAKRAKKTTSNTKATTIETQRDPNAYRDQILKLAT